MLVYKNVTIGNFGEPVVIRDTGPKAQLMQAEREKEVLTRESVALRVPGNQ